MIIRVSFGIIFYLYLAHKIPAFRAEDVTSTDWIPSLSVCAALKRDTNICIRNDWDKYLCWEWFSTHNWHRKISVLGMIETNICIEIDWDKYLYWEWYSIHSWHRPISVLEIIETHICIGIDWVSVLGIIINTQLTLTNICKVNDWEKNLYWELLRQIYVLSGNYCQCTLDIDTYLYSEGYRQLSVLGMIFNTQLT